VPSGLDPPQHLRAGGRLGVEVTADHRLKLVEILDHREIELRHEVGREHDAVMAIDHEGLHNPPA
jgi:hypothetical protein